MNQSMTERVSEVASQHGMSLRTGLESLGRYGREVETIAEQCDTLFSLLQDEPDMDVRTLENYLKLVSGLIDQALMTLNECRVSVHRKMTSIGNQKRIDKAYHKLTHR
jgi:hypothetical protein